MMSIDLVFYIILGIYLDQIIPSQFGVAKPWNFCCKRKAKQVENLEESNIFDTEIEQDQLFERETEFNYEKVTDGLKKQESLGQCL